MKRMVWLCLIFTLTIAAPAISQVKVGENGTLSTLIFGDYYWIARNHNDALEGNNGFWFRRIYFTYDHNISDSFTGRLRLEMSSSGDFATNSKLNPVVKDAYLKWSSEDHAIYAGISSTPTFSLTEEIWGYRSVEKSPQDLYKFGSSRDFGLSFKGNIGEKDRLKYHFMFANGSSNGSEVNKGKKFMLALTYYFTKHFLIQGYGDWNDKKGNTDIYTAQGFMGYKSNKLNVGALYSYQFRNNAGASGDLNLDLVSLFANTLFTEKVKAFARVDHLFDAYPNGPTNAYIPFSDQAESTFLTGGADVLLDENVHLIPNIEAVIYGKDSTGMRPGKDLIPKLTLFYIF